MKFLLACFLFITLSICFSAEEQILHFRIEASRTMQGFLTQNLAAYLRDLPKSSLPGKYSIGVSHKTEKPVLQIASDLPDTAQLFAAAGTLFAVSHKNPVTALTKIQADSILAGKLTHWEDNGLKIPVTICILQTGNASSDYTRGTQKTAYFSDPELLVQYMANNANAIAILPLKCVTENRLRILPVENIKPDMNAVLNNRYPYATLYRILWDPENPVAVNTAKFLLSKNIARHLMQCGEIPLAVFKQTNK